MNQYPQRFQNVTGVTASVMSNFISKVYAWMMIGILLTGFVSYKMGTTPSLMHAILTHQYVFIGLILIQLGAVITLSAAIHKLNVFMTTFIYLAYSALTGVTLSLVFLQYAGQSITLAFSVTAVAFGGLSAWGYVTKRDLGPIGSFCIMGLFGIIGIFLLSIFIPDLRGNTAQLVLSAMGVIVFAGLTAYDTQKLKVLAIQNNANITETKKAAVFGALMLYLDFINLFLSILRLIGDRK